MQRASPGQIRISPEQRRLLRLAQDVILGNSLKSYQIFVRSFNGVQLKRQLRRLQSMKQAEQDKEAVHAARVMVREKELQACRPEERENAELALWSLIKRRDCYRKCWQMLAGHERVVEQELKRREAEMQWSVRVQVNDATSTTEPSHFPVS